MSPKKQIPFTEWLQTEQAKKAWTDGKLAREAELPERTIQRIRTRPTDVRTRVFFAVVRALGHDPVDVYGRVTFSSDSSTARERSLDILGMLHETGELALAGANG